MRTEDGGQKKYLPPSALCPLPSALRGWVLALRTNVRIAVYGFLVALFAAANLLFPLVELSHWFADLRAHAAVPGRPSPSLSSAPDGSSDSAGHQCHSCILSHLSYLRGGPPALSITVPAPAGPAGFIHHPPLYRHFSFNAPSGRAPPTIPAA